MQYILYGLQYSGKTTVGKAAVDELNVSFVDLDKYIVEHKLGGKSVDEYVHSFADIEQGWKSFRNHEHDALREVIEAGYELISLGGGTIAFERNRDFIDTLDVHTIFLEVDVKTQVARYIESKKAEKQADSGNENRVTEDSLEAQHKKFQQMYDERIEIYEHFADTTIAQMDTVQAAIDEVMYQLQMLEYREEIDTIDDQIIQYIQDNNIDIDTLDLDTHELKPLLEERWGCVQLVGKLKSIHQKDVVDLTRKVIVREKWKCELGESGGKLYDRVHQYAVNLEKNIS